MMARSVIGPKGEIGETGPKGQKGERVSLSVLSCKETFSEFYQTN